jgi:hypothetical protein
MWQFSSFITTILRNVLSLINVKLSFVSQETGILDLSKEKQNMIYDLHKVVYLSLIIPPARPFW